MTKGNDMKRIAMTGLVGGALLLVPTAGAAQGASAVAEGARAWANTCTRCHNARPSIEHDDREWVTIMAHMRARANLTRTEARLITHFLQATNGAEAPTVVGAEQADPAAGGTPGGGGDGNGPGLEAQPRASGATGGLTPAEWRALLAYLAVLREP